MVKYDFFTSLLSWIRHQNVIINANGLQSSYLQVTILLILEISFYFLDQKCECCNICGIRHTNSIYFTCGVSSSIFLTFPKSNFLRVIKPSMARLKNNNNKYCTVW